MKAYTDYRKDLVSVRDRMGERLYQDDCQELIDDRQEIYDILAEKYEELNNELNSGGIEQGTEKWYEMKEELIGIKSEMINCANAVEDLSCCSAAQQVGCPVRTGYCFLVITSSAHDFKVSLPVFAGNTLPVFKTAPGQQEGIYGATAER